MNERALRQHVDRQHGTVSIVASSSMFRFILDVLTFQEAFDGLEGYTYWIEALRSGLYETLEEAVTAAEAELPWIGQGLSHPNPTTSG